MSTRSLSIFAALTIAGMASFILLFWLFGARHPAARTWAERGHVDRAVCEDYCEGMVGWLVEVRSPAERLSEVPPICVCSMNPPPCSGR